LSPADTEALLDDMIRDGRRWADEVDRNGPPLYFADTRLNNPLFQTEIERRWGWSWLREAPDVDIDASTILAPDLTPEPQPALSMTQTTLRQFPPPPPALPLRWSRVGLEIEAESFYRLLPSPEAIVAGARPEAEPATAAPSHTASLADIERQVVIAAAELKAKGKTPGRAAVTEVVQEELAGKHVPEKQVRAALKKRGLTLPAHRPREPR
jgi:hypothetical protein